MHNFVVRRHHTVIGREFCLHRQRVLKMSPKYKVEPAPKLGFKKKMKRELKFLSSGNEYLYFHPQTSKHAAKLEWSRGSIATLVKDLDNVHRKNIVLFYVDGEDLRLMSKRWTSQTSADGLVYRLKMDERMRESDLLGALQLFCDKNQDILRGPLGQ